MPSDHFSKSMARSLLDELGDEAFRYAGKRLQEYLDTKDLEAVVTWQKIVWSIGDLLPEGGGSQSLA